MTRPFTIGSTRSRWLALVCASVAAPSTIADTLIHAGRLIDGRADTVRTSVTVVVSNGRIARVLDGYAAAGADDSVVDLRDATLMPGLMDMHVHMSSEQSPQSYTDPFFLDPADLALRATSYMERTLLAGFTTVRDLGAEEGLSLALRDAVANGWIKGPRVIAAGSVTTTGGHGDPIWRAAGSGT